MEEDIGGCDRLRDELKVLRRDVRAAGRWSRRVGDMLWLQHIVCELRDAAVAVDAGGRAPLMSNRKFQKMLSKDSTFRTEKKMTKLFRIAKAAQRVLTAEADALAAQNTSALQAGLALYSNILSRLDTHSSRLPILPNQQPKGTRPVLAAPRKRRKRHRAIGSGGKHTRRPGHRKTKRNRRRSGQSLKLVYRWVFNRGIRAGAEKYWNYSFFVSQDFNKLKLINQKTVTSEKTNRLAPFVGRGSWVPFGLWLDVAVKTHCKDCKLPIPVHASPPQAPPAQAPPPQAPPRQAPPPQRRSKAPSQRGRPKLPNLYLKSTLKKMKKKKTNVMAAYNQMLRGSDWDPHIKWLLRFVWLLREEAAAVGPSGSAENHMSYNQFSEPFGQTGSRKDLKRQKALLKSTATRAIATLEQVYADAEQANDISTLERGHAFWQSARDELDPNCELARLGGKNTRRLAGNGT